jgi:predicted ribosomally synthesized peptide with nif11-like leader
MSKPEVARLVADLRQNPDLLQQLMASGPSVQWVRERGYDITQEELTELVESYRELSDDELEQAAGGDDGWGGGTPPPPGGGA